PDARFFTEIERFDRHLEKLRRNDKKIDFVSICSPNYLHDSHIRLALRLKAHAICEKPLVINPWNLDALQELEEEHNTNVYTILQLRLLPSMIDLRKSFETQQNREKVEINLKYITRRGQWYHTSWKGDESKSGGVAMNIGIHFFDLLIWLFGDVENLQINLRHKDKIAGKLELEWATVNWQLSVDEKDLPEQTRAEGKYAYRSMTLQGEEIEFSNGFTDLHTKSYQEILNGDGFRISDAKKSVDLVYKVRTVGLT
ncbi:MAG: Gfo/Idh/MocA family oxidoreductase, partial [Lentisphaerales bacterium]|nr:Gfo/Idh/MocA family oxidoreductase [Lentisphaerales bacterium]